MKRTAVLLFALLAILAGCAQKEAPRPQTEASVSAAEETEKSENEDCVAVESPAESKEEEKETSLPDSSSVSSEENAEEEFASEEISAEENTSETEVLSEEEEPEEVPEEAEDSEPKSSAVQEAGSFVRDLQIAQRTDSVIAVSGRGTAAEVSFHVKNADGVWEQLLITDGYVGYNGIGQASEGSLTTPEGVYPAGMAFGVAPDPGCPMGYTQLNDTQYWVDDPDSVYYNQFVSTEDVTPDWNSAEHLINATQAYAYCLEIGYNPGCVPGAGSAMFLHCSEGVPTYGCVAISQDSMIFILQHLQSDTLFVMAEADRLFLY